MSEEDTVPHSEESTEEEEQMWSRALIEEYRISDQEVIHKIKLHERINNLEKEVQRLNKLLSICEESRSDSLAVSPGSEGKRGREFFLPERKEKKKVKLNIGSVNFDDYLLSNENPFVSYL